MVEFFLGLFAGAFNAWLVRDLIGQRQLAKQFALSEQRETLYRRDVRQLAMLAATKGDAAVAVTLTDDRPCRNTWLSPEEEAEEYERLKRERKEQN